MAQRTDFGEIPRSFGEAEEVARKAAGLDGADVIPSFKEPPTFSWSNIFLQAFKRAFPAAGKANAEDVYDSYVDDAEDSKELSKAKKSLKAIQTLKRTLAEDEAVSELRKHQQAASDEIKRLQEIKKQSIEKGYKNYKELNDAFNKHPLVISLNMLFPQRNLLSGSHELTKTAIGRNFAKDLFGFPESKAKGWQAWRAFGFRYVFNLLWNLGKIAFNIPLSILKIFTEVAPDVIRSASKAGFDACLEKIKQLDQEEKPFFSLNRFKIAGYYLLAAISGLLYLTFSVVHFVGRAFTSPFESAREWWNSKEYPRLGKFMAVLSVVTSITAYALVFTLAIVPAIHALSLMPNATGTFFGKVLTTITAWGQELLNIPVIGSALSKVAGLFSFIPAIEIGGLAIGAAVVDSAAIAFGLVAGIGTFVVGTILSGLSSLASNGVHKQPLRTMFVEDTAATAAEAIRSKNSSTRGFYIETGYDRKEPAAVTTPTPMAKPESEQSGSSWLSCFSCFGRNTQQPVFEPVNPDLGGDDFSEEDKKNLGAESESDKYYPSGPDLSM